MEEFPSLDGADEFLAKKQAEEEIKAVQKVIDEENKP